MLIRTDFVGRESELDALTALLGEAFRGQPRLVLCDGEPGIGKTRLAEELLERAAGCGAVTAWGSGVDSTGAPPYWPWRQALRAIGAAIDLAAMARLRGLDADVTRVAPDVFGASNAGREPEGALPTVEDRFRQFDAVARLLRLASVETPLAIVLDDAHWADTPSLLLLQHVARALTEGRMLLMVNSRDTEPEARPLLAELRREPVARVLHLRGLSAPAVGRQLAMLTGSEHDVAEIDRVRSATGGNPFFVAELGHLLAERGPGRPGAGLVTPPVRDAIAARVERLAPEAGALLRAAAVLGTQFSVSLAASMAGLDVERALDLLDAASAARLVQAGRVPAERQFVHALVRDAIEAGLSTAEQVRLHRAAAESIERQPDTPRGAALFDLARHWTAAAAVEQQGRAAGWIERAAVEAMGQRAYEEASRLFGQALHVGAAVLDDETRGRLLLGLSAAANLAGDFGAALDSCLEAADVARRLGRADLLAQAALGVDTGGPAGMNVVIRRLCQEAAAFLPEDATALRAQALAKFAETYMFFADAEPAGPASEEALRLAEACGDTKALAVALRARQVIRASPEGLEEREQLAARLLRLSRSAADVAMEMWAHLWQIDTAFERGDLGRVAAEIDAMTPCAEEVRGPLARFHLLVCRAVLAQARGQFADALRLEREASAVLLPTRHQHPFHVRAGLLTAAGRHIGQDRASLAAASFEGAAEGMLDEGGLISAINRAHAFATAGRLEEAAEMYRLLQPVRLWRPPPHVVLLTCALGIGVAVALGESEDVAALRERLLPYRGHHVVSGTMSVVYLGPVELWLGVAAHHRGMLDEAVHDLERAERACAAGGAAGFQVEAQYELASALAARGGRGDVTRARTLLATAAKDAAVLGMAPFVGRIERLVRVLEDSSDRSQLTRREREVAALVAEGLTNREIAGRLFTSERTAENHVQHILTKLGLANRSQVAAWVAAGKMSSGPE